MKPVILIAMAAALPLTLGACELDRKTSTQNGYRGTGMNTVIVKSGEAAEDVPAPPYEMPDTEGPRAGDAYENVTVLSDVSVDQFNYTMAALTEWVSPEEGCNYCHNPANMASDEVYTKIVARRMLQMTRAINQNWDNHVQQTGVTCWTCHRGKNVPDEHWTLPVDQTPGIVGNRNGQNRPVSNSAYSSLPTAAVARYLLGGVPPDAQEIRVVSKTAHPSAANTLSVMESEPSYAIMMHVSQALGVNCTYCHNSQSFQSWAASNPPRETAWYGVRMVRDINLDYITPLAPIFPKNRLGEAGDPFKVNCTTCHRAQNKPLGGFPMLQSYPALRNGPIGEDMSLAPLVTPSAVPEVPVEEE
ncbi:hypothetical protein GCM10011371_22780 [Novosphingobium marinum]|uniref:Photosynthetic reaction center cytochrome c subunit n=1 Tax=Novosphingobium marinum TaxID=1514948 RepID=A0A7Y9XXJ5_9SPHN|nr:photosynthetic reaction center cytochrome PufC [Novosphingobium marinum]NYH96392.1 photosynthetic reaction center cytochrome c subunit [Novosphingobium marinum]GGC34836.1 hypothetical protein GCM10011371_22780 [Novosphingobium marinum]